ncbi:hypothetical protein N0V84_002048 [Fusarium piperis]|uniref:Uncharacterized protein n=1 Tax=Fusarium piperis TaxID=1435070 RepID=A0A9W8WJZ6_9HYPO|nr:hypothetical protein N0V84_002048 [Fusarium piperis]
MECVKFGYDVFAQPCDWHFTFPEQENGVVLVLPGLERHSGNLGEIYESPMMIQLPQVIPSTKIKHYFLAPNFDTEAPPKGPIHLGSILYNLTDFKPLEEEVKEIPPDQYYPIDEKPGFEISLDQLHSADRDLRARALKLLGLGTDPSTKRTKGSNQVISCQRLETHTFKATDSYIQAAIKADDNINSFLRLGIFKRSVYMVTGLKIAYSASQTSSTTRTTVDAGLDPSAIPVHLGTGFGFENSHKVGKSLRASKPIIVAFKVKKIWLNCLDRKAVMMVDGSFGHYEPVITMLSDDELALEEVNELFGKYGDDI